MPKVSVIIPTYNRSESLPRALTSVLHQTFQDLEIVVVDDASTDDTARVVQSFGDGRIRYIRHDTNKKEAETRNTGVRNSRGDYIAFIDDDDEWLPEKLELQVNLLDSSPPIVGAVYTGFVRIDSATGKPLSEWISTKRGNIFHDMLSQNWVGTPSTVVLKRACFDAAGLFDPTIVFGPDYDMWLRISQKYQFDCIRRPLVKYYVHSDRLSTNYELMIAGLEAKLKKHAALLAMDSKSYSRHYLNLGTYYCISGNTKKGRVALLRAIRLYPFEPRHYYNLSLSFLGGGNFNRIKRFRDSLSSAVR
jgi:glycosyltransferase involved in cell wall biosynthesis